jgi:GntR family transcriptional regulator, transcriptional repressor for pyruvate dehydrogenase complex
VDYLHQVQREERLADKVAELLKKAIVSGQLKPGDRLPPERILGDRFGVSRTVIREAVRSLAAKGLVEVRSGSGSVVARVEAGSVTEMVRLYVQGASIDDRLVYELRELLQVHAAGAAAERATEADFTALQGCLEDAGFHRAVVQAAHNPLLELLLDALGEASAAGADEALGAHTPILERIAAGDREGAREAMRRHLASYPAVTGSQRA